MNLPCESYQDFIHLYIDHALSEPSTRLLEKHLLECEVCKAYLETIQEDLPTPIVKEKTDTEQAFIKKLERRLLWTQSSFLFCGILICILFTLSQNMFQNLALLPLIGLLGYLFTKKLLPVPLLTTFILSISSWLKEGFSLDMITMIILLAFIYCILTLVGSGAGYLVIRLTHYFKTRSTWSKTGIFFTYLGLALLCLVILLAYNESNGNPFTALYAKKQMEDYLAHTYEGEDFSVHETTYNAKFALYDANAYIHGYKNPRPFTISYKNGRVWDDYFDRYLEDIETSRRLGREAASQIKALLNQHAIPFSEVSVSLRVSQNTYNDISFDKTTIKEPLSLSITLLTDTKDSYEDFSKWCEAIRNLITIQDYNINSLTLDSDPYSMVNRLSLILDGDEIYKPIQDISVLESFIDYGKLNHITDASQKDNSVKDNLYKNELLSNTLITKLHEMNLPIADVIIETSPNSSSITIEWFGERVCPYTFATTCITIRDLLVNEPELIQHLPIQSLDFSYYWGTMYDSYYAALYGEDIYTITTDKIVEDILSNEKY